MHTSVAGLPAPVGPSPAVDRASERPSPDETHDPLSINEPPCLQQPRRHTAVPAFFTPSSPTKIDIPKFKIEVKFNVEVNINVKINFQVNIKINIEQLEVKIEIKSKIEMQVQIKHKIEIETKTGRNIKKKKTHRPQTKTK